MSRKKAQRARPRSLGKKLTPKQAAFVHHYSNPKSDGYGNATRACERAGYAGAPGSNQLAVQGWRNLRQPEIQVAMRAALSEQGFTPEFVAKTLMGAMRATVVRALPNRKGKLVPHKFPDHRTRLQGYDRASRVFGVNKPSEQELIDHQLYGAERERRLAPCKDLPESEKQKSPQIAQFSPQERMLMREGYTALEGMFRILMRQPGLVKPLPRLTMADLRKYSEQGDTMEEIVKLINAHPRSPDEHDLLFGGFE
jgi:hypothetical protein